MEKKIENRLGQRRYWKQESGETEDLGRGNKRNDDRIDGAKRLVRAS